MSSQDVVKGFLGLCYTTDLLDRDPHHPHHPQILPRAQIGLIGTIAGPEPGRLGILAHSVAHLHLQSLIEHAT